jgi:hypothetical protein
MLSLVRPLTPTCSMPWTHVRHGMETHFHNIINAQYAQIKVIFT